MEFCRVRLSHFVAPNGPASVSSVRRQYLNRIVDTMLLQKNRPTTPRCRQINRSCGYAPVHASYVTRPLSVCLSVARRDCNPGAVFSNPGIRDRGISNPGIPAGLRKLPLFW